MQGSRLDIWSRPWFGREERCKEAFSFKLNTEAENTSARFSCTMQAIKFKILRSTDLPARKEGRTNYFTLLVKLQIE